MVVPLVRDVPVVPALPLVRDVPLVLAVVAPLGIVTRVDAGVLAPFVVTVPFDGRVPVVPDVPVAVDCVRPVGMLGVERPRVVPAISTKQSFHINNCG